MGQMEEFFYRELLKYLKLAEEKRRWNVFKDIPWDRANPDSEDTLAHCVETFCAVEMYLPDFTSKLLEMIRISRGRSWFHVNWGYEESKHSLALEAWLLASGHRTEEQREEVERNLLGFEWDLPFDHPRQMVCYTMIQELATFWNYRNLEKIAARNGDHALVTALRLISVDERVHYNFYRNTVKEWMKHDDRGTVEDLKYVFDNFTMPGRTQIPNYEESARILAKTGIYGPREYIKLVKNPILEDLKLDKDFNILEAREAADNAAKEAEQQAMKREQIAIGNGHAVPKNSSPLNGRSTPFNSHAVAGVLSNLSGGSEPKADAEGPKKSPLLQQIGIEPKRRAPSPSLILSAGDADKLPGSRGMAGYTALDQALMVEGDEKSNNDDEMRHERAQIRSNRVKNDRLFKKYNEE
jgi:acyl-[acyl-carrier-protein] desaturase